MVAKHGKDGYFQGAGSKSKWPAACEKYQWKLVAELCPKVAETCDETPNWLRERLEIQGRKGNGSYKVADGVYDVVDSVLSEVVRAGVELNTASVEEVLKDALAVYNNEVTTWRGAREKSDLAALDQLASSGASQEEIAKVAAEQIRAKQSWPLECKIGETQRSLNQLALDFCKKYGYANYAQDKPQKHLPRDHPSVKKVTEFIKLTIAQGGVNPKLVGHWDQALLTAEMIVAF